MSGNDLVFNETAVNYIMDDVERAALKLREGGHRDVGPSGA